MSRVQELLKRRGRRKPYLLKFRSSKWFILTTVMIASFTDIFLYGVIVPVIPFALTTRFGVPEENVQSWVSILLAVFGAALLVVSPFWGWLADRIPDRRTPFLFGLFLLVGATVMLAVGRTIALLIIGRALQGISSAIVWISSLALLVDTVGSDRVGEFMGYVGASLSLAILLAPVLGGVVGDKGGYEPVFAMCAGLIAVDIILRVLMIEKKVAVKWLGEDGVNDVRAQAPIHDRDEEDAPRTAQDMTEVASTTHDAASPSIDNQPHLPQNIETNSPSSDQRSLSRRCMSAVPLIALLTSPSMWATLYATLIEATLMTSIDATLPLRVSYLFGWSYLGAGLILLPMVIPNFFEPFVGYWVDKNGPRLVATLGFILACPFFVLLRLISKGGFANKAWLCVILFGEGCSLALTLPPIMAEISNVVVQMEREKPGIFGTRGAMAQAYALFNFAFAGGCLVGPVWAGFVTERAGWGTMTWSLGLLAVTTAAPTFLFLGGPIWKKRKRSRSRAGGEECVESFSA